MIAGTTMRVPTLWHGQGIASSTVRRLTAGRRALAIVDSVIPPPFTERSARTIMVDAPSADVETVVGLAREIVRVPPDVIVAVGGGSILDAGKIAALALAAGPVLDYAVAHASRSALTLLPDAPPPVDLIAVPTTLGTSSETNSVGVLRTAGGYRLIVGRALRPRHAVIDPDALATLTEAAVREGALEAFLRLAGASTSPRRSGRSLRDARSLGRALLEAVAHDSTSAAGRLRLARLSAATQRCTALRGSDPYSARHWYVANEVAFGLGVRKMIASAGAVPAVWRRICAGDARWGDRQSLESFWSGTTETMALPLAPPAGLSALLDRWEIPGPPLPTGPELDRIAGAIEGAWGNRMPMLPGLREKDFLDVLRDSRWSAHRVGDDAGPRHPGRRR